MYNNYFNIKKNYHFIKNMYNICFLSWGIFLGSFKSPFNCLFNCNWINLWIFPYN